MNRSKFPLTAKAQKKMKKELRSATLLPEPAPSKLTTPQPLLSRFQKQRETNKALLKSITKKIDIKKTKDKRPHSKRATAATVNEQSPPQIVHIEGRRWIKTIEKQNIAQKKTLSRHLAKKKK